MFQDSTPHTPHHPSSSSPPAPRCASSFRRLAPSSPSTWSLTGTRAPTRALASASTRTPRSPTRPWRGCRQSSSQVCVGKCGKGSGKGVRRCNKARSREGVCLWIRGWEVVSQHICGGFTDSIAITHFPHYLSMGTTISSFSAPYRPCRRQAPDGASLDDRRRRCSGRAPRSRRHRADTAGGAVAAERRPGPAAEVLVRPGCCTG